MAARVRTLLALLVVVAAAGCGNGAGTDLGKGTPASVTVTSPAFPEGGAIPVRFTCDGPGTSPPLTWTGGPEDARSWALVVDDPDAPRGTFVHWVVLDLPGSTRSLGAGATPEGSAQAVNSAGRAGYAPPCPPGGRHHYRFSVYALSAPTGLRSGASLADALDAIGAAAVAHGTLVATYERRAGQ